MIRYVGLTTTDERRKIKTDERQELRDNLGKEEENISFETVDKVLRRKKLKADMETKKTMKEDLYTNLNKKKFKFFERIMHARYDLQMSSFITQVVLSFVIVVS